MKILFIAHDSSLYGASQSFITLIGGLRENLNFELLVILPFTGKMEQALKNLNIDYTIIPFPRCFEFKYKITNVISWCRGFLSYYFRLKYVLYKYKNQIKYFNPDLIYTNTSIVSFGYEMSRKLKVKHVWHIREFGDIDYNFIYYPSKSVIGRNISKSTHVVFGSNSLKEAWVSSKLSNFSIIYNGIVDDAKPPNVKRGINNKKTINLGILAAICPGKGQLTAIKALSIIHSWNLKFNLFLYGDIIDQNYGDFIKKLITDLGLYEYVHFKGFVNDRSDIYRNIDILLNCSAKEGFGRTIVEAMHYAIPVIANKSGGALEIIEDNLDGMFFDDTVNELADKIKILVSDKELYQKLSGNGVIKASKFSVNQYVNSINNLLTLIINN